VDNPFTGLFFLLLSFPFPFSLFAVSLLPLLISRIRETGPLTVAEFMELALYHPEFGYYSRSAQRSGRTGDFYTSVDVGPIFGELIAVQLAEMGALLGATRFDLVEAGAGNGRLARDIMDAASRDHPDFYDTIRLTLVERSPAARAAHPGTLGPHAARLVGSTERLPGSITGAIVANELVDALPVHVVTMTTDGLREIAVAERDGVLVEVEVPLSSPALDAPVPLEVGDRLEVALEAMDWIGDAAAALDRGFVLLFDYGCEASPSHVRAHPHGTLMAYRAHRAEPTDWLAQPGEMDLTAHVDLGAIRHAARRAGLEALGAVDQTYFMLGLGVADRLETGDDRRAVKRRLAARTLVMPGGLGSTMKALAFAKGVGRPSLRGMSSGRLT
jgi:SAM-dependent MidA family methyltransferase